MLVRLHRLHIHVSHRFGNREQISGSPPSHRFRRYAVPSREPLSCPIAPGYEPLGSLWRLWSGALILTGRKGKPNLPAESHTTAAASPWLVHSPGRCWRPIEMSRCAPDRNVSVNPVLVVRWKCVESPFYGDFRGLWEEGETGQFHRPVFHAFHQDRHFQPLRLTLF